MFAGTDCLEGNICAAIRVLVMAERHCGGVLTLRRELESEGGGEKKKRKRDSSAGGLERAVIKYSLHYCGLFFKADK